MVELISEYVLSDMLVKYVKNEAGQVGFELIPASLKDRIIKDKKYEVDPLIQVYIRCDNFSGGFANGHTMRNSQSTYNLKFDNQCIEDNEKTICITTFLKNNSKHFAKHILIYNKGCKAFEVKTVYSNMGDNEIFIEMLSSFSFGGLTPFIGDNVANSMVVHRFRSCWSAEGRIETSRVEDLQLEPSWSYYGVRSERFGQVGSMPVRKFFPFAAVEDIVTGVTWAAQLACGSSWQMEFYRKDNALCLSGGLADFDFGHWVKKLAPSEEIETPSAYITVGKGNVDEVAQRLLTIQKLNFDKINKFDNLPVLFNEFCTTWGVPSHKNLSKIAENLKGKDIDFLVIDCGWYGNKNFGWWETSGDWIISEELFPEGLDKTVKIIEDAGMKPGIWFEPETCAVNSNINKKTEWLLRRNGTPVDTGSKRFLDMSMPQVHEYLDERVIGMLQKYKFKYIKIDYNDSIGIGCDGFESFGEGLRQNITGSQRFFKRIREQLPDIVIENCSSGGHRLEPSFMALCNMASFSDAHECEEMPVIAANLHRLILPAQSQIWAVLRANDSIKRLNYSLINTMLGVMCLSGDIYDLNESQWAKVSEGISFYRKVSHIIMDGFSTFYGTKIKSYRKLEGWQAVVRYNGKTGQSLIILHTFGGALPKRVEIPVRANEILNSMTSENNSITLENSKIIVEFNDNFEAMAVWCK